MSATLDWRNYVMRNNRSFIYYFCSSSLCMCTVHNAYCAGENVKLLHTHTHTPLPGCLQTPVGCWWVLQWLLQSPSLDTLGSPTAGYRCWKHSRGELHVNRLTKTYRTHSMISLSIRINLHRTNSRIQIGDCALLHVEQWKVHLIQFSTFCEKTYRKLYH